MRIKMCEMGLYSRITTISGACSMTSSVTKTKQTRTTNSTHTHLLDWAGRKSAARSRPIVYALLNVYPVNCFK